MNGGGDEKEEEWTCVVSKVGRVKETREALERVVVALPVREGDMAGVIKCDSIDRWGTRQVIGKRKEDILLLLLLLLFREMGEVRRREGWR